MNTDETADNGPSLSLIKLRTSGLYMIENIEKTDELSIESILSTHTLLNRISETKITKELLQIIHLDLFHQDDNVAFSAMKILERLHNKNSIKYLMLVIHKHTKARKIEALNTIKSIRPEGVMEELLAYFTKELDNDVKYHYFDTLCELDPKHPDLTTHILYFSDKAVPDTPIKQRAIGVLGKIKQVDRIEEIIEEWEEENSQLSAIQALGDLPGYEASKSVHVLRSRYRSLSPDLKLAFIETLSKLKNDISVELLRLTINTESENFIVKVLNILSSYPQYQMHPNRITRIVILQIPYFNEAFEELLLDTFENYYQTLKEEKYRLEVDSTLEGNIDQMLVRIKTDLEKDHHVSQSDFEQKMARAKNFIERETNRAFLNKLVEFFESKERDKIALYFKVLDKYIQNKSKEIHLVFRSEILNLYELMKTQDFNLRFRIAKYFSTINFLLPYRIKRMTRMLDILSITQNQAMRNKTYEVFLLAKEIKDNELLRASMVAMARLENENILKEARNLLHNERKPFFLNTAIKALGWYPHLESVEVLNQYLKNQSWEELPNEIKTTIVEAYYKIGQILPDYAIIEALIRVMVQSKQEEIIFQAANAISKIANIQVFEGLMEYKDTKDEWIQEALLIIVGALQKLEQKKENLKKYQDFNYHLLNSSSYRVQLQSITNLVNLKDEEPLKLLWEMFDRANPQMKADILWRITDLQHLDRVKLLLSSITSENEEIIKVSTLGLVNLIENRSSYLNYIVDKLYDIRSGKQAIEKLENLKEAGFEISASSIVDEKEKFWFNKDKTRYMAVMFIDIVGFTKKSSNMDLVEIMNYLRTYEEMTIPVIDKHKGSIVKKMGDGLMIAFQSSMSAVLAAIRMSDKMKNYNLFKEEKERIITRIGINSGDVAIEGNDLFGDTVNVASRMENIAQNGKILISKYTYNEVKDFIECKSMGPTTVKGKADPIETYEVISIRGNLPAELDPTIETNEVGEESAKTKSSTVKPTIDLEVLNRIKRGYMLILQEVSKVNGLSDVDRDRIKNTINLKWIETKKLLSTNEKPHS